jgi:hypothetical protein
MGMKEKDCGETEGRGKNQDAWISRCNVDNQLGISPSSSHGMNRVPLQASLHRPQPAIIIMPVTVRDRVLPSPPVICHFMYMLIVYLHNRPALQLRWDLYISEAELSGQRC